jgi:hypothetical protein
MKFHLPNYDFCLTDRADGHKGGTSVAVKTGITHSCVYLLPLLSVEATRDCIPIVNTEMLLVAVYKSPQGYRESLLHNIALWPTI